MKASQTKEVVMAMVGEGANIEVSSYNETIYYKEDA
jgi:hypothetical protein